jgi:hypothetical protein
MSNNIYTWDFQALEVYKQQGTETDVVYNVHWRYKAETGSFSTENYGAFGLKPYSTGSTFVPFDQITKELMTEWVVEGMGTASIQEMQRNLDSRINDMINPPTQMLGVPWTT